MKIKSICIVFYFFLALCPNCYATDLDSSYTDSWDFEEECGENFYTGKFFPDFFVPQIITDVAGIRQYIIDDRFQSLRNSRGDMYAIDAIYLKSLKITDHNIARALFISFMAVLEHHVVDIKMPIISYIGIPLTFESSTRFLSRVRHLPTKVYSDSPLTPDGDRDKLQHFFGSAYLAYLSEAPEFARITGNLIELGEEAFVVGGANDPRDKRANKQGEKFGGDLLVVTNLLPSDYLTFRNEQRK